jgi:hypothetical protein
VWGQHPLRPISRTALGSSTGSTDRRETPRVETERGETPRGTTSGTHASADVPYGAAVLAGLMVVASIAALVSATGVIDASWRLLGSLALIAIGAVAVAGSVNGRPPGLHGAGFALMIALVVVIVPLGVDGSLDTRAGFGAVTLFDQRAMGASIERRFISGGYETMERRSTW